MNLSRLHDISLKWKLLIPFLFLAFMGATALFVVSYRFQASLIHVNEEKRLRNLYQYFLNQIDLKTHMAMSLAHLVAGNPDIGETFAKRDRQRLIDLLHPAYQRLHEDFGVNQFHFHVPPATSFLRLHALGQYGEEMDAYRHTIKKARETGTGVGGLEWGVFGFGIRSVVPVFHGGRQVGTVEFGLSFEQPLLEEFKKGYGADLTLYVLDGGGARTPRIFASTVKKTPLSTEFFDQAFNKEEVVIHTAKLDNRDMAIIAGPVRDFSSKIVAVVEIMVDRSPTIALLKQYGTIAVIIGLAGLALSISFVWLISVIFTKRIEQVVQAADEIAAGHRDARIEVKSADELGTMARAINEMLTSLEESRRKVKDYAQNLESMVEHRTRALKESEETYRTLVENVPLIVYMVMADGSAMFLNRFVEQTIGVTPRQLSGHHELWAEHIHPNDRARVLAHFARCLSQGNEFIAEYRMIHDDGRVVYVIDHAIPVFDNSDVIRLDGIVMDVTARRELEQKIVQAEELQTLREVSARLAHEIRNPLTSVGGLTRRLLKSFDTSDPRREKADLIIAEVERLEKILKMMTAYIEPTSIRLTWCDLNRVVNRAVETVKSEFPDGTFAVTLHKDPRLREMKLDCHLFEKVLTNLMENAFFRMKEKGEIQVATDRNGEYGKVILAYEVPHISDDDIEHFFYPFVVDYPFARGQPDAAIMDVPMCRVIIHKHGGIINVNKENNNVVKITIALPFE
ncbi:MAG: PAS domain-containing protein [Desulfobacterales bacterium]|nr:MAG: PAS domain-containing protein [Desulfobacterales bacterium]